MPVTPLDSTDQRIVRLVSRLGDPVVETAAVADALSIGQKETRFRLDMLEDHGWVTGESRGESHVWQVSSKGALLLRTDEESMARERHLTSDDIIEAPSDPSESGGSEST